MGDITLIWLKVNDHLHLEGKQAVLINACRLRVSLVNPDGWHALRMVRGELTVDYETQVDISEEVKSHLVYDGKTPEKGFIIQTQKTNSQQDSGVAPAGAVDQMNRTTVGVVLEAVKMKFIGYVAYGFMILMGCVLVIVLIVNVHNEFPSFRREFVEAWARLRFLRFRDWLYIAFDCLGPPVIGISLNWWWRPYKRRKAERTMTIGFARAGLLRFFIFGPARLASLFHWECEP